jgi:hypothetical protein
LPHSTAKSKHEKKLGDKLSDITELGRIDVLIMTKAAFLRALTKTGMNETEAQAALRLFWPNLANAATESTEPLRYMEKKRSHKPFPPQSAFDEVERLIDRLDATCVEVAWSDARADDLKMRLLLSSHHKERRVRQRSKLYFYRALGAEE